MDEAQRAEALGRERQRALEGASPRPLWMILVGFLVLSFAIQRGAAAAFAYAEGGPAQVWLALAAECAAAAALGLGVWTGARWAERAAWLFAAIAIAAAAVQGGALGLAALPTAIARALVVALGAAALIHVLRRHSAARAARKQHGGTGA
jgi:hypothetical protein